MRYNLYVFITISCFFINCVIGTEKGEGNNTVFTPTTEWQIVKKGTPIPKGLHVRHNFQTGITEAKLIDPEETNTTENETSKSLVLHPNAPQEDFEKNDPKFQPDDGTQISVKEFKAKLKEMKRSGTPFATKFQSNNKWTKDLESLSFRKSAEVGLISASIEQFNTYRNAITSGLLNSEEIKIIMDILSQLEYLVHDIDNGLEFTKSGGLVKVIYPCLNGTIEEIKLEALHVFGAAVQSNPKVKEAALEAKFIPSILRIMTQYGNHKLMNRCIYALGSLVRHYPVAQKVFLNHGGLEIFSQVLADSPVPTQIRIMNLINDLLVERQELDEIDDSENRKLKMQDYADVQLEEKIVQHKFCTQLSRLLVKTTQNMKTRFTVADRDLLEAIYEYALTAGNICQSEFWENVNEILYALNEIKSFYNVDPELNSDKNDLLFHLLTLVQNIQESVFEKSHDEL